MEFEFRLEDFGNGILPVITVETDDEKFELVLSSVDGDAWATKDNYSLELYDVDDYLRTIARHFIDKEKS